MRLFVVFGQLFPPSLATLLIHDANVLLELPADYFRVLLRVQVDHFGLVQGPGFHYANFSMYCWVAS